MADPRVGEEQGLLGGVRRALDATVGRVGATVGEAALDVTGATAQQVIEDLEPYLVEEAIPRIVAGITPYLTESVVPEVLEGIQGHLVEVTIPEVVDGVTDHLVGVTVPQVVEGVTPRLVEDLLPRLLGDLRPYLEVELVPRIVDGIQPLLANEVAPELVDALMPKIRDDVAPELVTALLPMIEKEVAPQLVEALMPTIEAEVAPRLIDALMPRLKSDVAPDLVDALMPKIRDDVAPQLVDSLMPRLTTEVGPELVRGLMPMIEAEVAPQLVDALMPRIEAEVAPQLVDALLPKIRAEVVPTILEDIVDDPRVRDLIREQSAGLFLDALEALRENMADGDDMVESFARRVLRRQPRPRPPSGTALVLDADGRGDQAQDTRATRSALAAQRAAWRRQPMPPAPPGREFAHAGVVTRLVAFAIDVTVVGWLVAQGVTATISLLESIFDAVPNWANALIAALGTGLVPLYMAVAWAWTGRTLGAWLVGTRVCTPEGRNPGFVRALVRAYVGVFGAVIWIVTGVTSLFDGKRRSLLDELLHTEVRYVVPINQQHRYVREALLRRREGARPAQADAAMPAAAAPTPDAPAASDLQREAAAPQRVEPPSGG
jgi:uncharacterized RDD family membrane protein YckC